MKILILGAAGRTGRELVTQAMAGGNEVTAFARATEHLPTLEGLRVIVGDAENPDQVAAAAQGNDAVVSALGHTSTMRSAAQTVAIQTLIKTLPAGTKVISLTGFGVPDAKDPAIPLLGKIMNGVIKLVPGDMFNDGRRHVELLRASKLAYTVVRAPRLTTAAGTGHYELGYFSLSATDAIARADVAAAMLGCLSNNTWDRQTPMIRAQ